MFRRLLPLAGLLAVTATAAVVEVQLPCKELRLKNGLLFTDVTLKSFNTSAGTTVLLVNKDLVSVRTALLPDEVAAKLKELTPVLSKEEQEAEKLQLTAETKLAAEKAGRRQQQAEDEAKETRAASRALNVKTAEAKLVKADTVLDDVAKIAEAKARSYFKYQPQPGSTIGAVVDLDLEMDDPEPVPGWTGRYRVCGTVGRQYINNRSSSFDRDRTKFEMLLDTEGRKTPKVVDITVK